ncbi:MAG: hypothetical protein MJ157_03545, partial [Clostridia bacterium]|nr:hypothetical protein [Clostridia bacterium]
MLLVGGLWLVGLLGGIGLALAAPETEKQAVAQILNHWEQYGTDYSLGFWLNCLGENLLILLWLGALGLSLIGCPLIGLTIWGTGFWGGWTGVCLLSPLSLKGGLWFG